MKRESATASEWYVGFSNSTGQPAGDKIVLSRIAPHFIRLEIEAPGVCAEGNAARQRRIEKYIHDAVFDLQKQSFSLMRPKA